MSDSSSVRFLGRPRFFLGPVASEDVPENVRMSPEGVSCGFSKAMVASAICVAPFPAMSSGSGTLLLLAFRFEAVKDGMSREQVGYQNRTRAFHPGRIAVDSGTGLSWYLD
ncbi:hypothetical protein HBI64_216910 [Parastagonospora nodorum]|nr:hypothetical protein HBI64_216910 [Parastagonospora nodorum]